MMAANTSGRFWALSNDSQNEDTDGSEEAPPQDTPFAKPAIPKATKMRLFRKENSPNAGKSSRNHTSRVTNTSGSAPIPAAPSKGKRARKEIENEQGTENKKKNISVIDNLLASDSSDDINRYYGHDSEELHDTAMDTLDYLNEIRKECQPPLGAIIKRCLKDLEDIIEVYYHQVYASGDVHSQNEVLYSQTLEAKLTEVQREKEMSRLKDENNRLKQLI